MKIYLGLIGSEELITNLDRDFNMTEQEAYEDVVTEDESIYRYTIDKIKHFFNFRYGVISKTNFDTILTEHRRKTTLQLKLEKKDIPDTYDNYSVVFDGPIDYTLESDYAGSDRYYKDVSFILKEL
ncbi:hypothetical protein ES708_21804 [subsurface metagenome]